MTLAFRRTETGPAHRDPGHAAVGARPGDRLILPVYGPATVPDPTDGSDSLPQGMVGFQIATRDGENIQGDDADPSGYPSYAILDAATARAVIAAHGERHSLALQVIFADEIEEPDFVRTAA